MIDRNSVLSVRRYWKKQIKQWQRLSSLEINYRGTSLNRWLPLKVHHSTIIIEDSYTNYLICTVLSTSLKSRPPQPNPYIQDFFSKVELGSGYLIKVNCFWVLERWKRLNQNQASMDEGSPDWINVTCDSKWHLGKGCWCKENRPPFQPFLANLTDPAAEVENRVEGLHLTFGCRTIWARWQKSNKLSKATQGTSLLVIICLFDVHLINIYPRLPNLPSSLLMAMCEEPPLLLF